MAEIKFLQKEASREDILEHLKKCDNDFKPSLSSKIDLQHFADKIFNKAVTFEAWKGKKLIGLVASYYNCQTGIVFITCVSVLKKFTRLGIASKLLKQCIEMAKTEGFSCIKLSVENENLPAYRLYEQLGFVFSEKKTETISSLILKFTN